MPHQIGDKPVVHEFEYRPKRWQVALLLVLACGGAVLCGYFALYADRGAVSARGIRLTRDQFRLMAGIVALLSPIGIASMAALLISSFVQRRRVAITADSLIVPKPTWHGMSSDEIEIPLAAIRSVSIEPFIGRMNVILVVHDGGALNIPSNMFPRRGEFEALFARLAERSPAGRG